MKYKLVFHQDPGHGWVQVPKALLAALNIADKISPYSYMKGDQAYVEEDGDLCCLCNAIRANGDDVEFIDKYVDRSHPIRNYAGYEKPAAFNFQAYKNAYDQAIALGYLKQAELI